MRGLLMIEPLYHRTVNGLKTQTRRSGGLDEVNNNCTDWEGPAITEKGCMFGNKITRQLVYCKPRYKVGEILFLKEPYNKELIYHDPDNDDSRYRYSYEFDKLPHIRKLVKWKNKLFMPAEAARAYVRITDIKCERLLDISDNDCIAEGIETGPIKGSPSSNFMYKNYLGDNWFLTPKESFISLFRFANKIAPKNKVDNIWVFAYTFEYLKDYNNGK